MKTTVTSFRKPSRKFFGITPSFIASLSRNLALATLAAVGLGRAEAANFSWDPLITGSGLVGGGGTWDLTTTTWYNGTTDVVWPNNGSLTDVAVFDGSGGLVTIDTVADTGVAANGLTFNVGGYVIGGAVPTEVITLGGTTPTVTVTNAADSASITATISGAAGLTKAGAGRLDLSGSNNFTGNVSILAGTLGIFADNNLGAAANGVLINGTTLAVGGTFTSARTVTLGALGGTINVDPGFNFTLSAALPADANALTANGGGTLTLAAASTRTGITTVSTGTLVATNVGALGTGDVTVNAGAKLTSAHAAATQNFTANVILNGGTFSQNQPQVMGFVAGKTINIGAAGGTLDVSGGVPTVSKISLTAGQLIGTGALTKTGTGNLLLAGANPGLTGGIVALNGGVIEFQNVDTLGTGTDAISVASGAEFVNNGLNVRHNFTLSAGATLSANGTVNVGIYSGSISAAGNASLALRYFQTPTTADGFTISGSISGSGNLTATAPAAATLTITGNRSAHTGQIIAGTNATVLYSNASTINNASGIGLAGGTSQVRVINTAASVAGTPGLNAIYYNLGSNPNITANNFAVDQLYLTPRTFGHIDQNINLINNGSGDWPVVPVPGFTVGTTGGGQNTGAMWKGLLNITTAGSYQFSGTDDDNYVLILDGQQLGTLGVIATNTLIGGAVTLSVGPHSIVVKHSQGTGGGYATLSYAGPDSGGNTVLVPPSAFTTGSLATLDVGPVVSNGGGTLDVVGPSSTASLTLGNGTLTFTSPTIDNLTAAGAVINAATPTLAPTTAGLIVTGAITETGGSRALNFAGPYFAEFQGTNSFTGLTTITGGQLRLNALGGNSIVGNITLNAANGAGSLNNLVLKQSNQIADAAIVTVSQGVFDLNSNSETIGSLVMTGGLISGTTGVLTTSAVTTFTGGTIAASLAGGFALSKTGTGTAFLTGNNSFTGVTTVSGGILQAQGTNSLGAGGAGNGTTVSSGASLRTVSSRGATEDVTIAGTGIASDALEAALRNLGGNSLIRNLITTAPATIRVDSGELTINGTLDVTGGPLTKTGNGTLTFGSNQSTIPVVTHLGGALGFSGPQSFGAATVPAGLAYQFDSNPLAGGGSVSLTVGPTSLVIANYAADQTFLGVLAAGSTGTLALTGINANDLNLAAAPNVSLGAVGIVTYTGSITPNPAGLRLGGGGGRLSINSVLTGTVPMEINGDVVLNAINTVTGTTTVKAGGRLILANDTALGTASNLLVLDGGILQLNNTTDQTGGTGAWTALGHPSTANGGGRILSIGAGGGTIDLPARQSQGNFAVITTTNGLIGSGTLTKTGLGMFEVFTSNSFSGALVLASNSSRFDLRDAGALPNVASVTIESNGRLDVDNNATLGAARLFVSVDNRNRFNDAAPILLNGGTLRFASRNVAFAAGTPATSQENFGVVTAGFGQSFINSTRAGGGGSDLVISNLIRTYGSGTVNFTTDGNTLGQFGDNPRIILTQLNGAAPTLSAFIAGWATINQSDFAAYGQNATVGGITATSTGIVNYGSTGAPAYAALTAAAAPGTGGWVSGAVGNAAAALALGAAGPGQNFSVGALRFGSGATAEAITFAGTTGTPDTIFVESGGIITDNGAGAKSIGVTTNAFTRGQLTAGTTSATTPQELFFHNNTAAALTVNATIINNPNNAAATVRVIKAQDGTVVLDSGANTYSGGTQVLRGTLTANNTGSLGTGSVVVKNSILNLANKGATTGVDAAANAPVYTTFDQSTIVLTGSGTTVAYNAPSDRFSIATGSTIYANSGTAGFGFPSLTRVATPTSFTAGGQIYLAPGAIVKHNMTNAANQGTGLNTIQNLGSAADLFFAPGNNGGVNQTLTVGAGTPWAGLSSDRGAVNWATGTIYANSDFTLQGLTANNAVTGITLGALNTVAGTQGSFQIVNNTSSPINARIVGQVVIQEDEPVSLPSNLTFVVTAGALFQPNTSAALGFGATQAKVVVQSGGILDPGSFTVLGAAGNQNRNPDGSLNGLQNLPYPLPSPLNGSVTVEAGGKMIINDVSGIGSAPAGSYLFKTDSVLDLATNTSLFFGRGTYSLNPTGTPDTTGVAVPGQFVYEPGVIVRLNVDNIYKISQFTPTNGVIEVMQGTRLYTNQNNPFIIPVTGTPTIAPEDLTLTSGGILTNDANDRQLSEGRGQLMLGNGTILAGSSQTYFNIQEGFNLTAGANVTIGSPKFLDGLPKLGAVQLLGPNSNVAGANASFTVIDGAQLSFGVQNVYPDTMALNLSSAVSAFPGTGGFSTIPGNGSTLLLNIASFVEIVGNLTGNGAVIANQANNAIAVKPTSDITSNVTFKLLNTFSPTLIKEGPNTLTLTGNSDSQGSLISQQGLLVVSNGTHDWVDVRAQHGGTVVVDNTVNPTNNRLGLPGFLVGSGGTFELKGNATTPVVEQFNALASGTGNLFNQAQNPMISTIKVTPGVAKTTLQFLSIEAYNATGQRLDSYIINSPSVANVPMTYSSGGAIIPNATNTANGLVEVVSGNFGYNGTVSLNVSGLVFGSSGTAVMGLRNDLLGDANGDGIPEGFVTQDGVNYTVGNTVGTAVITGLPTTTGLAPGMLVTGNTTSIPAGTRILTVDSATQVTLTNNTALAVTNLDVVVGGLRNLAASEYATSFRDNQTVGLNLKLSGTTNVTGDSRVQSLTMTPGSTLNINGTIPNNITSSRVILNSAGIFVPAGGTATINGSTSGTTETYLQQLGGASIFFHAWGDLNVNTKFFSDVGIVKTGPGTMNVGAGDWNGFRGSFQIDGGTVNLGANNNVQNIRSQNGSTATNFYINAGTLNLNGNSQQINLLNSASELAGEGGTVTSATAATILNIGGGRFAGVIGGAISLDKAGNNNLLLTNVQTYTGATTIRAGTLQLRDAAALSPTAGLVSIRNGTLQLDNSYLGNVTNRVNPATPVEMFGGTVNLTGAAGQVSQQTFNQLTLLGGTNVFTSNAGGSGANELFIGNLVRAAGSGAFLTTNQNYGFVGTAGNTTTAIRNFITNVNGSALALNDGIIGGWAIVNGDNFATYRSATGVGAYGNTADGYAAYESGDLSAATATQNVSDATARTIAASKTVNSVRITGAVTMTIAAGAGLTIDTGGLITNVNGAVVFASGGAGSFLTSNSGELDVFVNQNITTINVPITGAIDLVKGGANSLTLGAVNTYTGKTFATGGGSLTLSVVGADGGTNVAIPGPLIIDATTVTETTASQISAANSDITIRGGGRFNLANVAGITENIRSLTFQDGSGPTGTTNGLDRTALQITSTVNLTGATAITSTNTNPITGVPFIGGNAGKIAFTNPTGSTLLINSPTSVNGVLAVGLRLGAIIGAIPTGVPGGGLIKTGTGMLTIDPDQTPTFATTGSTTIGSAIIPGITSTVGMVPGMQIAGANIPAGSYIISVDSGNQITINNNAAAAGLVGTITAQPVNFTGITTTTTEALNITSGIVRADRHGSLGSPFAVTTVQSGAVLLGTNTGAQVVTGSVTLKDGSTLGATISGFTLGAATDVAANQSFLNIPAGANATIVSYDYFVPSTNSGNITINSKLTGAGTINVYGQQLTQGNGGGGLIQFGNPITSGVGSNDFSGTIIVGPNAIVASQQALIPKNVATAPRSSGDGFGTGTLNLAGGRLRIRDDATTGTTAVSSTNVNYNNPVTLTANSFMDLGRTTATVDVNSLNSITFGTLTVPSGTRTLTVDSNTGTGAGAGLGNYLAIFNSLDGAGSFVKGGGGRLQFNAIAPTFTGAIVIAGPSGNVLGPTANTAAAPNLILPSTATVPAFSVSGLYITEGSKTLNVTGALTVNTNPGNNPGAFAVQSSSVVSVGSFVNNGNVGASGGTATIDSVAGFSGTGLYVTNGQQLNLTGGGINSIKVAGNNVVNVTAASSNLTGTEIQSGILKLTNSAGASSGNVTILGSPASVASATTVPIAAVSGTLSFDGSGGTFTHTGNISSSGTVRASGGTVNIAGTVTGTAATYRPGLLEGFTTAPGGTLDGTNARTANPGNFGIRLEPRMFQMNAVTQQAITGHTDNDTWIYTGYVKDDDGVFSFAENIDDRAAIWVDGVLVLNANNGGTSRPVSTAYIGSQAGTGAYTASFGVINATPTPTQNFGPGITLPGFGDGWHLIELRFNNGTGGSGPLAGNGFANNYGLGYKNGIGALDGADYTKPIDNGTGNLFVTPVGGKGSLQVDGGATMNIASFSQTAAVTLAGGATSSQAFLNVTGADSQTDALALTGTNSPQGFVDVAHGKTLTVGALSVATNGSLTFGVTNDGNVVVNGATTINGFAAIGLDVAKGTVTIAATSVGSGGGNVQVETDAKLVVNGSLQAAVNVGLSATLTGSGSVEGNVTINGFGILSPDKSSTTTGFTLKSPNIAVPNTLTLLAGATYVLENKPGTLSDTVYLTGTSSGLSLPAGGPDQFVISLVNAGGGDPSGKTFVLFDGDPNAPDLAGGALFLTDNYIIDYGTTGWTKGTLSFVPSDLPNNTGNDIILTGVIPEPGTAALLLGGLAFLTGFRRRRES